MSEGWELELRKRAAAAERERDTALAQLEALKRLLTERTGALDRANAELARLRGEPTSATFKRARR